MEVKNKFNVEVTQDNKVHVIQQIIKVMTLEESMVEYNKLMTEHQQVEQQKKQLTDYINNKEAEANLLKLEENDETLKKLTEMWENKTKPLLEQIKKKIKRDIKQDKVKRGYEREKDTNKKIVLRANILGNVAHEYDLDLKHPIINEFRKEFDKV